MKLDPQKLKTLRETRSWTQEHLAQASGLSLRTIQRLEKDGMASADSRLSLAAAFEVELSELEPEPASSPATTALGLREPSPRERFRNHLVVWLFFSLAFVVLDVGHAHRLTWAHWPILGWGLGVLNHARKTFLPRD